MNTALTIAGIASLYIVGMGISKVRPLASVKAMEKVTYDRMGRQDNVPWTELWALFWPFCWTVWVGLKLIGFPLGLLFGIGERIGKRPDEPPIPTATDVSGKASP